ncbi:MAG: phospholipid carrier-dependent glycosyltransferase [Candidatus Gottesmanbacteria bacterium]|nr:phospholipid carrier-dependent glycosyltransferase [Candidatus Gottesmanbacteria bacterium]
MEKFIGKYFTAFLIGIGMLAFVVRLYHITYPVADWHSWRQSDTAAVARNFLRFGIDPLHPRYDDLSNIQSGKDNPQGWRMVEFPLYQVIGASAKLSFPKIPLEVWLRLVTIFLSVGTTIFLGLLVAQYIDAFTGVLAAFLFAILPYSIYYGRTILPDPSMVFWSVLSLWLIGRGKSLWWTIFAGIAGAIALLSKPMAAFLLIPIPYIVYRQFGISIKSFLRFIVYAIISFVSLLVWRKWILQFPEGIPVSSWLLNGNGIRFKGAWFHWLFAVRLGDLMLGFWGLIPFGLGLALRPDKKEGWVFRWLGIGALLYLIIFATGNIQHDYYQILLIPVVAIYAAKGLASLFRMKASGIAVGLACLVAAVGFSWFTIRTYYWINHPEIVEAGRSADAILPKDAKVIAPYSGDTTFLYQTQRQGWPLGFDIDKKIAMGATAYVTVSPTDADGETKDLASRYTVLVRNDKFAIIDLTRLASHSAGLKK